MIRTHLESALRERFPDRPFVFHQENDPFATLDASYPEIGRLELSDDGDEITIYLTELMHSHFGCYEDTLSTEEKDKTIASDVVEFLESLFADRVVISMFLGGVATRWRKLSEDEGLPRSSKMRKQYVWSHPIID